MAIRKGDNKAIHKGDDKAIRTPGPFEPKEPKESKEPKIGSLSRKTLQAHFLILIEELCPAMLKELAGEPLTRFMLAVQPLIAEGLTLNELLRRVLAEPAFSASLSKWAAPYQLDLRWIHKVAVVTLANWLLARAPDGTEEQRNDIGRSWGEFDLHYKAEPLPDDLCWFEMKIKNRSHPTDGKYDRAAAKRQLQAHFDEVAEAWLDRVEEHDKAVKAAPAKFGLKKGVSFRDDTYLRWVIYSRCLKYTDEQMQKMAGIDWNSARDKITKMERLLDLPKLRKPGGARTGKRMRDPKKPKPEQQPIRQQKGIRRGKNKADW